MKKWIYWVIPVTWMAVIFYSSSQPYQEQDIKPLLATYIDLSFLKPFLDGIDFVYHHSEVSVSALGVNGFVEFFIRKGAHVTVFLLLFLAFYIAYVHSFVRSKNHAIIIALVSTVVYAAFDEIHQGFTPNRTPYVGDVLLDSFGALIGIGIVVVCRKISRKRRL